MARGQPEQDAIMDISSDGAVSPIHTSQPTLANASSNKLSVSPPPVPLVAKPPPHRPPSPDGAAAHSPEQNLGVTSHTGAGIFVLSELGWLAGLDSLNRWQDFGGHREHSESPWQTAAREFEEEAGISASYLVSLAPPYRMVKDKHIYVIHIAKLLPGAPRLRTNAEILAHKHFTGFSNKFADEIVAPSIVHRRVLDPEFLTTVGKVHTDLLKAAQKQRVNADLAKFREPTQSSDPQRKTRFDMNRVRLHTKATCVVPDLHNPLSVASKAPASNDARERAVARYSASHRPRASPAPAMPTRVAAVPNHAANTDVHKDDQVSTSSALQLAVTDAIASVTLAPRVDRGDLESCDDVGDDIPQGIHTPRS